jgi:DNA-binding MarR family transcriptional regulator
VNHIYSFDKEGKLLQEEKEIMDVLTNAKVGSLDLKAIAVVTNIYRVAQGLRNKMEREVLSQYGLSWTAFSLLYDLWVREGEETKALAESAGVTKATISNITKTLERKELCYRKSDVRDRRKTYVFLTDEGKKVIEELYPHFHQGEVEIVSSLDSEEKDYMSHLLRKVIRANKF